MYEYIDTIGKGAEINLYAYSLNNPINRIDISGLCSKKGFTSICRDWFGFEGCLARIVLPSPEDPSGYIDKVCMTTCTVCFIVPIPHIKIPACFGCAACFAYLASEIYSCYDDYC